ncbi:MULTISPECIES: anthranilate synthase component II [Mesonia]|uniref:Aminodeoxychorismate/anthranilate synthase component 2 n=1 Tax=Mesonia oceanica TaxID=2687242 RepID=A0AC61Y9W4_9FLAO|nr:MULTISPECIES: aminodeoxychorismate/anthranilate synthase component II [Mesonia]MAN27904.1 aminodeoxychorismate/anthranilate synthase component II [Mesonia sp.]MAQ41083.1 aminodeoxychorismate/anthranilate synthase component II [Mesonia sp.]MBJ96377.1 aminodeoxychorismate/anthranilate synthase component II [Flavobacteriaceae bacterium]VVV01179.1 Aminodeoxychorismate/anthranilate synthase component 2 [Mesonia oceanica]|tara:strand:+ start:1794 stop:2387 length:594 start_codon:yes stop_codon:yes gene_type:complete
MKKILVIDNYDSFVYNLVHYLEDLDCEVIVRRNNEIDLDEIEVFDRILLSPGPGIPSEAGLLNKIVSTYAPTKSILGVCLGQQAIGEVFGGKLNNLNQVFHGVATPIQIIDHEETLFKNLPQKLEVGRYHSWVVQDLPHSLIPTSYDENGQIMSLRHRDFQVYGVQFHPESVLTPQGKEILKNWIEIPVKNEETVSA